MKATYLGTLTLFLGVFAFYLSNAGAGEELRTWQDSTGRFQTNATLQRAVDGVVYLAKDDGRVVAVPMSNLSQLDQVYVQRWLKSGGEKTVAPDAQDQPTVTYSIIKDDKLSTIKRSIDVRLSGKTSESELRRIANELKDADPQQYQRTFISYFLPERDAFGGSWASSHFNPDLKVIIFGLTAEETAKLSKKTDEPSRTTIGQWLDERPSVGNKITIYEENGRIFRRHTFTDGSFSEELVRSGNKFTDKEENSFGEFYLIDREGNLQLWDSDGIISTAKKIE